MAPGQSVSEAGRDTQKYEVEVTVVCKRRVEDGRVRLPTRLPIRTLFALISILHLLKVTYYTTRCDYTRRFENLVLPT